MGRNRVVRVLECRTLFRHALIVAGTLGVAACAGSTATNSNGAPAPARDNTLEPLEPGDALKLNFWREPELSGQYEIDEAGMTVLPLLGARDVTTLPAGELKRRLTDAYNQEIRNQEVQITLLRRVRVLGEVNQPGLYYLDATMTLGDAIALAGSVTGQGKQNDIRIVREGREVNSNLSLSELALEQVTSGDEILVPERSWFSRYGAILIGATISAVAFLVAAAAF